ncbi:MAG: ABC transporter substrate-binding protein [Fimbriimonadaceae bacterium]|nr:ABC transporter substrate-binding protein [Fimbriimonadaceae bacterium]
MSPKASLALLFGVCAALGIMRADLPSFAGDRGRIELNFWNGFTGPDGRTMLRMIRRFNEQNPDVRVSMQRMDWATYYNKLMVAAMDGRGPEVFVIHASTLPRMHRAGFVSDVRGLFEGPEGVPQDDFDPYVLNQVRYGEKFVGLPLDIHPQGLYGNADMLKEAGFVDKDGHPRLPETREEFLSAARKMRKDLDGDGRPDVWGFALTLWRNNFQSLMPQFGGRYLDEKGNADLDNPGNVAALEFLSILQKEKLVPPPENGLGWVGYRQKKVAMVFDGVYMLGDLQRLNDMPYLGGPIPLIGKRPGTMADSHVLCVREGLDSRRRQASARFIKFLSANSVEWAGAGQVPARRSVRQDPEFLKMPVQSAFARQVPFMLYPPRTTILFELTLEIDLAVEKVMRGRTNPAEALRIADENAQRFLDRDRRERGTMP